MKIIANHLVQFLIVAALITIGAAAWYANIWFENNYQDVDLIEYPTSTPPPSPVITRAIATPGEGTPSSIPAVPTNTPLVGPNNPMNSPTPVNYPTIAPTFGPVNTPTLRPAEPTNTPAPQTFQATGSFFKVAICSESYRTPVGQIITDTEAKLAPIKAEYDACKVDAEAQVNECVDSCGSSISCMMGCEQLADELFTDCESVCNFQKIPIVNSAVGDLKTYCNTVEESSATDCF